MKQKSREGRTFFERNTKDEKEFSRQKREQACQIQSYTVQRIPVPRGSVFGGIREQGVLGNCKIQEWLWLV